MPYNKSRCLTRGGNNGKPSKCASGASCRAQADAVASGEVGSGDCSDRIIKRYENIAASNTTDPNRVCTIQSHQCNFEASNGLGAKGSLGKNSEGITSCGRDKNSHLDSCEAQDVASLSQKNRGVSESEMGSD